MATDGHLRCPSSSFGDNLHRVVEALVEVFGTLSADSVPGRCGPLSHPSERLRHRSQIPHANMDSP